MRRLLLMTLLVCLAAPPAALAMRAAVGDGTLAVRDASGTVRLEVEGAVVGRLDTGQLELISPTVDDCRDLDVWGADRIRPRITAAGNASCVFTELVVGGTIAPIRFRLALADNQTLIVRGTIGLSLSAVGQGRVTLRGSDGTYSKNGQKFVALPDEPVTFRLAGTLE